MQVVGFQRQLDPSKPFVDSRGDKRGHTNEGRRFVFLNNRRCYVQLYDEQDHGEWSQIKSGDTNGGHRFIPKHTLDLWGGVEKRGRGGQSQGRVYELDDVARSSVSRNLGQNLG